MSNGIDKIENSLYTDRPGRVVYTNKNADKAAAVIISDDGVVITNAETTSGVRVHRGGVTLTGGTILTSKATNVKKGEFSENPKSSKIFTYKETVLFESIPKSIAATLLGVTTGLNTSVGMDGAISIHTDPAPGPLLHYHSISMKHVHRIEPAYLYSIPPEVGIIQGALSSLKQFFSAVGA